MRRISIIAVLSVLTATSARAGSINLDIFGNLALALLGALNGDIVSMTAGTTVSVGALLPLSIGLQIQSSDYATRGTLNFASALGGLTLNGGIGFNSIFTSLVFSGKPISGYTLDNTQTTHLDNVEFINSAGIRNSGDLTITNSTFTNNSGITTNSGGAIYNYNGGSLTISNTTFTGNTSYAGGAMYIVSNSGTLTINGGTSFISNTSQNGGAIYATTDTIFNTNDGDIIFDGNIASEGGAFISGLTTTLISTTGNDLIFRNNIATGGTLSAAGAILNTAGTMNLDSEAGNILFINNRVDSVTTSTISGMGGAILNYHNELSISVADGYELKFDGNTAANGGGAIYNGSLENITMAGTSNLIIGDNAIFTNNTANTDQYLGSAANRMGGGAIMNYGDAVATIGDNAVFSDNTSAMQGGAIFSDATSFTIGDDATFTGNTAGGFGGAIYNYAGTLLVGGGTEFSGNTAKTGGGAIYNAGTLTFDASAGKTKFDGNTVTGGSGGAIYFSGANGTDITGNMEFTNNTASVYGGAIYNDNAVINLSSADGDILFQNNKATSNGGAIYNTYGTLNISNLNGNTTTFDGNTAGGIAGGAISSAGTINIGGGTTFTNNNVMYYGGAIFNGGTLTLDTTTGGDINFSNNTAQMGGDIYNDGILNILGALGTEININSTTGIYNDANNSITKTGENTLNIAGGAAGAGAFTQTAGVTIAGNGFFTGGASKTYVETSSLSVTSGFYNYGLTLGESGSLLHISTSTSVSNISNSNLVFKAGANNAIALFNASTGVTGNYNLVNKIENGGTNNTVGIDSSIVTFGSNDYTGTTHYNLTNNYVNLSTPDNTLRTLTFDNLSAFNTTLSFDLYADVVDEQVKFTSDKIVVNNPDAGNPAVFKLGALRLLENADNGLDPFSINEVLSGATFEAGGTASIATTAYEYLVTVNDELTGLDLEVTGPSSNMSLNNMNIDIDNVGTRGFNFSFFKGPQTYSIGASLDEMVAGTFTVIGFSDNAADSVIDGGGDKSIFKMYPVDGEVFNFTLANLTLANAYTTYRGAALAIGDYGDTTVNLSNLRFINNHSDYYGGAVDASRSVSMSGEMYFEDNSSGLAGGAFSFGTSTSGDRGYVHFDGNATFINNGTTGFGNGGAIHLSASVSDLDLVFNGNAIFHDNYTAGGGSYAAIYLTGGYDTNIEFNGDITEFVGNHADAESAQGGAIGTSGLNSSIKFNMNENTQILFDNNTDSLGYNDIVISGGQTGYIYFQGTGGTATINGGIADSDGYGFAMYGTDTNYAKDSAVFVSGDVTVNFGADSVNEHFYGRYIQNGGTTNIYTDNWIGRGVGEGEGMTLIMGGTMNIFNSLSTYTMALMEGGTLDIRAFKPDSITADGNQYNTLTLEQFVGDGGGNIWMNTNGSVDGTDKLVITESATGDAVLNFTVVGSSPIDRSIEVVDYTGATSDATFSLANGAETVDVGAWAYSLENQVGDGWYLNAEDLNSTAQSVMGIPAIHLSMVKTGMNELRKRLGALRNDNDNDELVGGWVRGYGKYLKIHELVDADMTLFGFEGGIDFMANALNGKVYFGIMGGFMDSEDIRFDTSVGGASGWTRTPSVGAYATWIHKSDSDSKWFVDLTARHFWAHTQVEKEDKTNGYDVTRNFWAFSAETGKLFYMESPDWMNMGKIARSHVSIEPKLELRYKVGAAEDFETYAHDQGHVDLTQSFSTHLNIQMNFLPNGTLSDWRPYIELGVYNEWLGNTEMEFAGEQLCTSDTSGLGFTATVGTSAELSDWTYAYGGYTLESGTAYTSHQLNIGIRTKF